MFKPRFGGINFSLNACRAVVVGPLTFFLWIWWAFTRRRDNFLKSFSSSHMTQQLKHAVSNLKKSLYHQQSQPFRVKQQPQQQTNYLQEEQGDLNQGQDEVKDEENRFNVKSKTCPSTRVSINMLPVASSTPITTQSSQGETRSTDHLKPHPETSCTSGVSRADASSREVLPSNQQQQPHEQKEHSQQTESTKLVTTSSSTTTGIQSRELEVLCTREAEHASQEEGKNACQGVKEGKTQEEAKKKSNRKERNSSSQGKIRFKGFLSLPKQHGHRSHHRRHRSRKHREEPSNYSNSSHASAKKGSCFQPIFEPIRSIYWTSLDLPKVYRIKQITRSCLNDVILAAVSGKVFEKCSFRFYSRLSYFVCAFFVAHFH